MTIIRAAQRVRRPGAAGNAGTGASKAKLSHLLRPADMLLPNSVLPIPVAVEATASPFAAPSPATISVRVPISPRTISAPASTSSSFWRASNVSAVADRHCAAALGRGTAKSICGTAVSGRCGSGPAQAAPRRWPGPPRPCFTGHRPEPFRPTALPISKDSLLAPGKPTTNCGAMRTR